MECSVGLMTYSFVQSGNGFRFCSTYKQSCGNCSSNHTLPHYNRIWAMYLCCRFHAQFRFVLARFKFHFFVLWLSILLKFIWYGHHHPRHVLVASNRPPFVLIRPYIRIRATLLRIAASAKLSHVILRLVNQPPRPALTRCRRLITLRFRCLPPRYSWSLVRHNHSCDHTPIIMRAQLRTYSLLNSLIHLLLSSLCSQSATCSFLFRVILLLAVVN